jgi:putative ABC transport system substrate-binding protein
MPSPELGVGHATVREFITLLGGAAAAWPELAQAQQAEPVRRIGVLMTLANDDPEAKYRIEAFVKKLRELGWIDGKNFYRWGVESIRKNAAELVALAPNVIVANAPQSVSAIQQLTRAVPVVFTAVIDPVILGFVQSFARPGGNVTGFTPFDFGMSVIWLELLKEIAPGVKQVAVLGGGTTNPGAAPQIVAIQTAAPSFGVELSVIDVSDKNRIERGVTTLAGSTNGGLAARQRMTHKRHWLCTAAIVLVPISAPIKVLD